jgi:hypothetical protein
MHLEAGETAAIELALELGATLRLMDDREGVVAARGNSRRAWPCGKTRSSESRRSLRQAEADRLSLPAGCTSGPPG